MVTNHFSEVNGVPIDATTPAATIEAIPPMSQPVTVTISNTSGTVCHLGVGANVREPRSGNLS